MMIDDSWVSLFHEQGYNYLTGLLPQSLCRDIHHDLSVRLDQERLLWGELYRPGIIPMPFLHRPSLLNEIVSPDVLRPVDEILGENRIYLFMASLVEPKSLNYASEPHADISFPVPDDVFFVGALLLLTDFSSANGATEFYPGSHRRKMGGFGDIMPVSIDLPAGSMILFDGRLTHRSTFNSTDAARSCLALGFCRHVVRPKFSFPAVLPFDKDAFSPYQQEKLGYLDSRVDSLDSYMAWQR